MCPRVGRSTPRDTSCTRSSGHWESTPPDRVSRFPRRGLAHPPPPRPSTPPGRVTLVGRPRSLCRACTWLSWRAHGSRPRRVGIGWAHRARCPQSRGHRQNPPKSPPADTRWCSGRSGRGRPYRGGMPRSNPCQWMSFVPRHRVCTPTSQRRLPHPTDKACSGIRHGKPFLAHKSGTASGFGRVARHFGMSDKPSCRPGHACHADTVRRPFLMRGFPLDIGDIDPSRNSARNR